MSQCPDFEYIRTKISIVAVARELGLTVNGYRARCWRTETHRNGDANPSIGFWKKRNKGRCFVCDPHVWSTIDLVMLYLGYDLRQAVSWVTDRFPVPLLPKGSYYGNDDTRENEADHANVMVSQSSGCVLGVLSIILRLEKYAHFSTLGFPGAFVLTGQC
jgi:hypothetical protein